MASTPAEGRPAPLDHLVYATPDLDRTVEEVAALTGVRPVPGGSHPGMGTRNALLGLGPGRYFEIVGPDPRQPSPDGPRWFGTDSLTGPRLVHWAVRVTGVHARVAYARDRGYDPGDPVAMARRSPDGGVLSWTLTLPQPHGRDGLVPFLLDWGATTHPSARGLPVLPLLSFAATHPEPGAVQAGLAALGALGTEIDVRQGPRAGLTAVLEGSNGPVTFGSRSTEEVIA